MVGYLLAGLLLCMELSIFWQRWKSWGQRMMAVQSHGMAFVTYGSFFLSNILRWVYGSYSKEEAIVSAFCIVLMWLRTLFYLQLSRSMGPFFIMVSLSLGRSRWMGMAGGLILILI